MTESTVLSLAIAVIVIVLLLRSVNMVPQHEARIVERLGKYQLTLTPGLHLLVPVIDAVVATIDMREQVIPLDRLPASTSDSQPLAADIDVSYLVADPVRAAYQDGSFTELVTQLAREGVHGWTAQRSLEQVHASRGELAGVISGQLEEPAREWGIDVRSVVVRAIDRARPDDAALPRGPLDPPATPEHRSMDPTGHEATRHSGPFVE